MEPKYETVITDLGRVAKEMNQGNMIILFDEDTTDFAVDFSFLHPKEKLKGEVEVGDHVQIDEEIFSISRVGENVNSSLKRSGHVVIKLNDGDSSATEIELDGECETLIQKKR